MRHSDWVEIGYIPDDGIGLTTQTTFTIRHGQPTGEPGRVTTARGVEYCAIREASGPVWALTGGAEWTLLHPNAHAAATFTPEDAS